MASKVIICTLLLVAAVAAKPYIGYQGPIIDEHVVGGKEAAPHSHPHIVSLQVFGSHFCAGILIRRYWVLTAAHCVQATPRPSSIVAKFGKHNLRAREQHEQTVKVVAGFVHKNYGGGVGPYDIGLLKLAEPVEVNHAVSFINLPEPDHIHAGEVVLSGWGSTSSSHIPRMPDTLQEVVLPIVDLHTCNRSLEAIAGESPLHHTNVCTGPLTGGYSACSGDSGGPLIYTRPDGRVELVGIVSWGIIPCGTKGAPSVYTRASAHNGWIENTINNY